MAFASYRSFPADFGHSVSPRTMRVVATSLCRAASTITALLLITLALTAMSRVRVPARTRAPAVATPLPQTGRVTYPAQRLPMLTLPNGAKQPVRSLLSVDRVLTFGDYVWNDIGVQPGPVVIRVDLDRQLVSVFRGGHEIGTALVLYGTARHPTPRGTLKILGKAEHYRSHKYGVPMEYTLWLNNNGIAIHASDMGPGLATYGCIGVPMGFARHLFNATHVGDEVGILAVARSPGVQ